MTLGTGIRRIDNGTYIVLFRNQWHTVSAESRERAFMRFAATLNVADMNELIDSYEAPIS